MSEQREGPFAKVCDSIRIPHGECRVIKVGSLPCRFLRVVMERGTPFRDPSKWAPLTLESRRSEWGTAE